MTLRRPSCHRRLIAQCDCFASRRPLRRWRFPSPLGRRWEYHTLSGRCQEYDALSTRWGYHTLVSAACWEYDTLSVRARLRTDAERVSYSQQAALADDIVFFATNLFYFILLHWVTVKIGLNGLDPDLDRNKHRIPGISGWLALFV